MSPPVRLLKTVRLVDTLEYFRPTVLWSNFCNLVIIVSGLKYCDNKEDALEVNGLIYSLAQKTHTSNLCGTLCNRTIYGSTYNVLSERVLAKELKIYGQGYYIIWAFYSTLYVNEKVETYLFDFDSTLVAIGGSLGLFLGWSIYSIIMGTIEFMFERCKGNQVNAKPLSNASARWNLKLRIVNSFTKYVIISLL